MNKFFKQLTALVNEEPAMKRAVDNIIKDTQSKNQPKGNIKPPVIEAIEKVCVRHPEDKTDHLRETIRKHQSVNLPELHDPVPPPKNEPLRRVVSLFTFVKYHMLEGTHGKTFIGRSYSKQDPLPYLKKDLLERFEKSDSIDIELDELQGSCGKAGEPTWWTFYEKTSVIPETGETYMQELALAELEIRHAEQDNTTIETSVDAENLGQDLFKPTALDSFDAETKFDPELTGKVYGYTSPQKPGLQSRPEVVSATTAYRDIKDTKTISIKRFPYKIEQ